jgi:5-methylcytosine-specific restriction endonuclease McrA
MGWRPPEKITKSELKKWLYKTTGGHCHYCKKKLSIEESTLDHKVPKSQGGKLTKKNAVLACLPCNQEKMALSYSWYKALWKQRRENAKVRIIDENLSIR